MADTVQDEVNARVLDVLYAVKAELDAMRAEITRIDNFCATLAKTLDAINDNPMLKGMLSGMGLGF